jgi:hypothetical protein
LAEKSVIEWSRPMTRREWSAWLPHSISFAPTILPRDADRGKFAAGAGCKAGAGRKLQRVLAVDRQGKRKSGPRIPLLVVALDAIQGGMAVGKIDPVQGNPDTRLKCVKEMCLNRIDRRLRKSVAAEEIGIEVPSWRKPPSIETCSTRSSPAGP